MATDSGTGETWRARRGHDDLVIAVAMAVWYLENPGPYRDEWRFEVEVTGLKLAPDAFYRRDARLGQMFRYAVE